MEPVTCAHLLGRVGQEVTGCLVYLQPSRLVLVVVPKNGCHRLQPLQGYLPPQPPRGLDEILGLAEQCNSLRHDYEGKVDLSVFRFERYATDTEAQSSFKPTPPRPGTPSKCMTGFDEGSPPAEVTWPQAHDTGYAFG